MNVANGYRLVTLVMFCGVAVFVIVNGQSTTDEDIDKRASSSLIDMVEVLKAEFRAELRAEQSKSAHTISSLKSELNDKIAQLETKGKRIEIWIG